MGPPFPLKRGIRPLFSLRHTRRRRMHPDYSRDRAARQALWPIFRPPHENRAAGTLSCGPAGKSVEGQGRVERTGRRLVNVLHPKDNVATALVELAPGTRVDI